MTKRRTAREILGRRVKSNRWSIKKIALYFTLSIFFFSIILAASAVYIIYPKAYNDLSDVLTLKNYKPNLITEVYDDSNKLISEFYLERRELLPFNNIQPVMKLETLAVEDDQFYIHKGFNFKRIVGAL